MEGNPITPNVELKPNSDKARAEREALKPVVTGTVKSRKGSITRKFAETFFSEDISNVKHYIIFDILIPGIRDGLYDIFSGSLSMMFYGETGRRKPSSNTRGGYVNYSGYSSSTKKEVKKRSGNTGYSYNDILYTNREDANDVKFNMQDIMQRYKMVTVADFYELSGEESDFPDQGYGWYDLGDMTLVRDGIYYRIKLPKAVPLD